ncbi:hypothetical protein NI17_003945 [Thermobifida halotolerans]|uniref:Uncharacterized protein n=1 Tax=Thermobifida halotolerans TaxID=483545 RepID=A0A399G6D7_9ACTN|nr:hypothetical protein [Thermobifida halotolerans]UOE20396.1 hypothetical protein NI17_003945 [Thermobifida halotolerans]
MNIRTYLRMMDDAEHSLAEGFHTVADGHSAEPDVYWLCRTLADQCERHRRELEPIRERYREEGGPEAEEPEHLETQLLSRTRSGPVGLLRDLQDLYTLACFVDVTWTLLLQAAYGLRDRELIDVVERCDGETKVQVDWLRTRMKNAAPQALIAAR